MAISLSFIKFKSSLINLAASTIQKTVLYERRGEKIIKS